MMTLHSIPGLLALLVTLSGLSGAAALGQDAPRVVLFEDPSLSSARIHYPLLITESRGYRILCASQSDEETVIRGLGFTTVPATILTAIDPEIASARPEENPPLCPTGPEFGIKVFAAEGPQGLVHYLQFPTHFGATTFSDRLFVPGCVGLVDALGLDLTTAIAADPTPFFVGKIHPITCLTGAPLLVVPDSFSDWCVKGDRKPDETATVMALLDATPGGITALGNPSACGTAQTFLTAISALNLNGKSVGSLAPLGVLTHLTSLSLANNDISDLAPLSKLTALGFLDLSGNQITAVTALSPLIALTRVNLSDNLISDIRALSALPALTSLTLDRNRIADLAPLQFLQALSTLSLAGNGLTGAMLEPLTALGALTQLNLSDNQIESFEVLGALSSTLDIDLTGNPIVASGGQTFLDLCILHRDAATPFGQTIRILIDSHGAGTCVTANNAIMASTTLDLSSKIISDIRPLAMLTHLTTLNLAANAITDIAPLAGLVNLTDLALTDNNVSDIRPVGPLLALSSFDATGNPVALTDFLSACLMRSHPDLLTHDQMIEVDALLSVSGQAKCQLAAADLGQRRFADFRNWGLVTLAYFDILQEIEAIDLSGNGLNDVTGLQTLPALTRLIARQNNITSIASFRPMTGLEQLILDDNPLNGLLGISDLTKLKRIQISNTGVRSVLPLADLPLLASAELRNLTLNFDTLREYCIVNRFDPIALGTVRTFMAAIEVPLAAAHVDPTDCTAVEDWANVQTVLNLNKKSIQSVDPVAFFPELRELYLYDNMIQEAAPIASLRNLTKLNLDTNRLERFPRLGSTGMRELFLASNRISDVSGLTGMTALNRLDLRDNRVEVITPLLSNPAVTVFDLRNNQVHLARNHDIPVLVKAYFGGNPVCTSFPIFLPDFPFPQVQEACARTPPLIFFPGNHFPIRDLVAVPVNTFESICLTCPEIRIRPDIVRPFIEP